MKYLYRILVLAIVPLFLGSVATSQVPPKDTIRDRIIRAEKPEDNAGREDQPALRVIGLAIGGRAIEVNSIFSASNNWLNELRVRVKNVSGKTLHCVGISFGVLAEIETKLQPHESWPWGLGMYKGDCGLSTDLGSQKKFRLRANEETELQYSDTPLMFRSSMDKMGLLAKAVFHPGSRVKFSGKDAVDTPLAFSKETKFLDDDPY